MLRVDSRKIEPGDTFLALKCEKTDGHDFINEAIDKGAAAVIVEKGEYSVKTITVLDTRDYLANYLKELYANKMEKIKLVGVTGTNGKTTSCYLAYQLLNKLNTKTAYLGTIGFYLNDKVTQLKNTTPDLYDLYELFVKAIDQDVEVIIMEVSSCALELGRVLGLKFDIVAFTNLTLDHLAYHKTFENYKKAKQKLFTMAKKRKFAIINTDVDYYKEFIIETNKNVLMGLSDDCEYQIGNCDLLSTGSKFELKHDEESYEVSIPLPGKFNIYNYLTALIITNKLGKTIEEIINVSETLISPIGRYDTFKKGTNLIVVDYAHTPDAVENIIKSVQEYKKNKIYTIIGCGGNRDNSKRPIMGKMASTLSDYVIFTNDNPREEDEKQIMDEITKNIKSENFEIIFDRKQAIKTGINKLEDNDILLVLGKGHEDYQIIGKEKFHLSDIEEVKKCI